MEGVYSVLDIVNLKEQAQAEGIALSLLEEYPTDKDIDEGVKKRM